MATRLEQIEKAYAEARQTIERQDELLKQILSATTPLAVVAEVGSDRVLVLSANGAVAATKPATAVNVGDVVEIEPQTGQVVRRSPFSLFGAMCTAIEVHGSNGSTEVEVSFHGEARRARTSIAVAAGDQVVLDPSGSVVVRNLGKPRNQHEYTADTGVSWDDIGGLQQAKHELQMAIELPLKRPELFARYGKKPTKGVLLYGPPGTGKTMLGKAAATALKNTVKKDCGFFAYVKGPDMLDKWVGNTEAHIRSLFAAAREHKRKHGTTGIIFIDEADAVLGHRGRASHTSILDTSVPQFLAEMDGLDDHAALLILATNKQGTLDSAVTRDGRVDRKIHVSRPGPQDAAKIFELYLKDKPLQGANDALGAFGTAALFDDGKPYYRVRSDQGERMFGLPQLVSGAVINGVVEQAAASAIARDITTGKVSGLGQGDIAAAVDSVRAQNRDLNHSEELELFCQGHSNIKVSKLEGASHA